MNLWKGFFTNFFKNFLTNFYFNTIHINSLSTRLAGSFEKSPCINTTTFLHKKDIKFINSVQFFPVLSSECFFRNVALWKQHEYVYGHSLRRAAWFVLNLLRFPYFFASIPFKMPDIAMNCSRSFFLNPASSEADKG